MSGILRPDKRRWAVLSEVQPLDKYIWKSASQVALFAYSPICETLHTKSIYLGPELRCLLKVKVDLNRRTYLNFTKSALQSFSLS